MMALSDRDVSSLYVVSSKLTTVQCRSGRPGVNEEIHSCDIVMLRAPRAASGLAWPRSQHITARSRRGAEVVSLAALSLLLTD